MQKSPTVNSGDSAKRDSAEEDYFLDLLAVVLRVAPPVKIPWLTVKGEGGWGGGGGGGREGGHRRKDSAGREFEARAQSCRLESESEPSGTGGVISETASSHPTDSRRPKEVKAVSKTASELTPPKGEPCSASMGHEAAEEKREAGWESNSAAQGDEKTGHETPSGEAILVSSGVEYFPLNIKKTVSRRRKRRSDKKRRIG